MRNGPPITAIIIDAGISIGANNVLPNVSASRIKHAPNNAENGISALWAVPTHARPIWGMSNPTNVNIPAIAVAIEASNTATAATIKRARFTLNPKFFKVLSFKAKWLQ